MGYRNIYIANQAHLSTKLNCMVIDNGEISSVPIEDIRCVMIENKLVTVSAALMSKLALNGVTVMICDDSFLPTSVLYPLNVYSRQLRQIKLQFSQSQPALKHLWQQTVCAKIRNQSLCLRSNGHPEDAEYLLSLIQCVRSGDPQNTEGKAAAFYFKALFGKDFSRSKDTWINYALNFGYSVIRSDIARTLAVYGFEPSLGMHHKSELNNFNLADDLIEPFRPVIDLWVAGHIREDDKLITADKASIFNIMNMDMLSKDEKCTVDNCIEREVQSLAACYGKKQDTLALPELTELHYHDYE